MYGWSRPGVVPYFRPLTGYGPGFGPEREGRRIDCPHVPDPLPRSSYAGSGNGPDLRPSPCEPKPVRHRGVESPEPPGSDSVPPMYDWSIAVVSGTTSLRKLYSLSLPIVTRINPAERSSIR